jgi:two-component system response regulator MtrA
MSMATRRVLVVEDNENLALGLSNNLKLEGYEVEVAEDGAKALEQVRSFCPHAVVLDLMLPEMDGYQVLRTIRGNGLAVPVLILTALGDEADKVRGFRTGADQYLTKPFSVVEFLSRVEALLRRADGAWNKPETSKESFGDVVVDVDAGTVIRDGSDVALTPKAFDLLLALIRRRGAVVSRHDLMHDVWGYDKSVISRTVDAHIAELRRKLEADPANPVHILTVWKRGYRFQP